MIKIKNFDNLIFGRNPLKEALINKRVLSVFLLNNFSDKTIMELIEKNNIPYSYISLEEMNKICRNKAHQGVVAETKGYSYSSLNEILNVSKKEKNPVIVVLDGIEDPHNLGAILRSCDVFGVCGVILPKHNSVSLNATVAKTSAGAINYIKVAVVPNINQCLLTLKDNGFWVVCTDGSAKQSYTEIDYNFPTVLVIGSEGKGVSKLVIANSDYLVKIPQFGHVNSLNASVAAGILLSRIKS